MPGTELRSAVSITVEPTCPSTARAAPDASIKVIFGIVPDTSFAAACVSRSPTAPAARLHRASAAAPKGLAPAARRLKFRHFKGRSAEQPFDLGDRLGGGGFDRDEGPRRDGGRRLSMTRAGAVLDRRGSAGDPAGADRERRAAQLVRDIPLLLQRFRGIGQLRGERTGLMAKQSEQFRLQLRITLSLPGQMNKVDRRLVVGNAR